MRTIDANALRDRLQNLGYDDWNQGTTTTWAEAFNECADMVDEQPTIEPERLTDDDFEKQIHAMFDHIWDCEIKQPVFQDTVGDLMNAVIQCHADRRQNGSAV